MVIHIFENVEGKPDGIGKYVWADNSQHEDQYCKGTRKGYGKLMELNGTIYIGRYI